MSKIAIIYKSKYGSTQKYAEWIAEATGGDLFTHSQIRTEKLIDYTVILYLGALYAVNILGISFIKNNWEKLKTKKLIIVSVGAAPETQKTLESVKNKNFSRDMQANIHFFHLRGILDYKKMNPKHRLMMHMLKRIIEKKNPDERDDDSKYILSTYGQRVDLMDKGSIGRIVEFINNF